MNHSFSKLSITAALLSFHCIHSTLPHFTVRSQSVNAAREIVGWQPYINRAECGFYSALSFTPEYEHTFHSERIARCLFGFDLRCNPSCGSTIQVSGSRVVDRGTHHWLADYFGLPNDYQSTLRFHPSIKNFLVDINWFAGFGDGYYFRIHAPIVYSRWFLGMTEDNIVSGTAPYDPGYFTSALVGVPRSQLLPNATAFFVNQQAPNLGSGVSFQPLMASLWTSSCDCNHKALSKTRLSDIEWAFGKNFWCSDDYLVGLSIRGSIPTGNKPQGKFLFEPIIGSGGFWKLGGAVNAHAILWADTVEDRSFGLYLDARLQHLFCTSQRRNFDLCGKPNSRYMLAEKLGTQRQPIHLIGQSDAGVEFQNQFAPVANLTQMKVNVRVNLEADVVIKATYYSCAWSVDVGYEFWGISCEKISAHACNPALNGSTWALKGDANVIGFANDIASTPVRLTAAQADATINSGTNNYQGSNPDNGGINGVRPTANPGITNPIVLIGANGATGNVDVNDRTPAAGQVPTRSSNPVPFIQQCDVDFKGNRGISNKLFMHISYDWCKESHTTYLGAGGEVEFDRKNPCSSKECSACTENCKPRGCQLFCPIRAQQHCELCAINQWGIWVKAGVAFN